MPAHSGGAEAPEALTLSWHSLAGPGRQLKKQSEMYHLSIPTDSGGDTSGSSPIQHRVGMTFPVPVDGTMARSFPLLLLYICSG